MIGGIDLSCSYYIFRQGSYFCAKKDDYINEDVYYRYCRKYEYSECPIYKKEDCSRCYLTSACVYAKGLSGDCYELETLRRFRDIWLNATEEGKAVIKQYYEIAPKIVSAINETMNSKEIYEMLYEKMVKPCVEFTEQKKYQETLELYRDMTLQLEKEYCL